MNYKIFILSLSTIIFSLIFSTFLFTCRINEYVVGKLMKIDNKNIIEINNTNSNFSKDQKVKTIIDGKKYFVKIYDIYEFNSYSYIEINKNFNFNEIKKIYLEKESKILINYLIYEFFS